MQPKLFYEDIYLKSAAESLGCYDVISFDLFDTLVFRTVYKPADIFDLLGRAVKERYSEFEHLSIEILCELRIEAERLAHTEIQNRECEDVTLEQIYEQLGIFGDKRNEIMEMELALERERIYINPNMYEFAKYCHNNGRKLAIVSDFYFSLKQVKEILTGIGIDCGIFSEIMISSEYGVSKHSGGLFDKLLDKFPQADPGRILHIGDNYFSDITRAREKGIRTLWYPVVPEAHRNFIDMEHCCYGETISGLSSLRALAMSTPPETVTQSDTDSSFWYSEGAGILGPMYAVFAEWVLDIAEKEGIKHILPFMREGELFTEVIRRTAANRNTDVSVVPLYISRRAAVLPGYPKITKEVIREYMSRQNLTIQGLFSVFYIDVKDTPFSGIGEMTVGKCRRAGCFNDVSDYLLQESTLEHVNKCAARQGKLLSEYVCSIIGSNDAITIDFQCVGTTQKGLTGVMRNNSRPNRLLHLVMLGKRANARAVREGIELRSWLGFNGDEQDSIKRGAHISFPLEAMCCASAGSTLSYECVSQGNVTPVLDKCHVPGYDKEAKKHIWDGIYRFQEYLFYLEKAKPGCIKALKNNKQGFLNIVNRLMTMPLQDEAINIGRLTFDEGYNSNRLLQVIAPRHLNTLQKAGGVHLLFDISSVEDKYALWPQGIIAYEYPNYYLIEYLEIKHNKHILDKTKFQLLEFLASDTKKHGRIGVYGFGKAGRRIVKTMWEMNIPMHAIIDKTKELQGLSAYGLEIISPESSIGLIDTYIITSAKYRQEIENDICRLYAGRVLPNVVTIT